MTYVKKDLLDYIIDNIDDNLLDVILDIEKADYPPAESRKKIFEDFFNSLLIDLEIEMEDLEQYKKEDNDFWNDTDKDGHYWCDMQHDIADRMVNIYNQDLYDNAWTFSHWTQQAFDEGLINGETVAKKGVHFALMSGEYQFYTELIIAVLRLIKEFINND